MIKTTPKDVTIWTSNILVFFLICACLFAQKTDAQTYPFTINDNITATLNVQTNIQEVFRNPLLGYNIFGFNSAIEKDFIRKLNPTTIRFPHGLFANWYDWRTDQTRVFGTETFNYIHQDGPLRETTIGELTAIKSFDSRNVKVGIEGINQLNIEREIAQGKGFDIIWTFNMSADSEAGADMTVSPETTARYDDLIARGFMVKDIELGNENFYPNQRSSFTPNAAEYVARAKSMSAALKAKDPNIQVSIPLLRRSSFVDPNWNAKLTQDLSYFDAITVHTYIGADPDNSANNDEAYSTALTARKSLKNSTNDFALKNYHNHGGNSNNLQKPVWLTEWGVKSGGPNAASVLGMADCYLFMAENQNIYQRANWFSVNGKLNSLITFEGNSIKYPLEKTAYGSTHEILKSVFENSTMLESAITTLNLEAGVKAVTARAVVKDGKTSVFVLNLTNKSVPFTLTIDGSLYADVFTHKAMAFDNVEQERVLPFDTDPLSVVKTGSGAITLPPLSINVIYLGTDDSAKFPTVGLIAPLPYSKHNAGTAIPLAATATDTDGTIVQVAFKVNDILLNVPDTTAPYQANFTPTTAGTYKISVSATDNDGKTTEAYSLIYVVNQEAYFGTPVTIPGIIEAENYDKGGQNLAYNDTEEENKGNAYRLSEGVDVGVIPGGGYSVGYVASGEWLEYSVNVQTAGIYDAIIKYSSGRSGGGTFSASIAGTNLFSSIQLAQTTGWSDYKTLTIPQLNLSQGIQTIRFTINGGGYNLDNMEFKPNTLSVQHPELYKFTIHPNPSKSGIFSISKSLNWEVYNITGSKLLEGTSDIIDISKFSKGLYIFKTEIGVIKKLIHN